MCVVAQVDLNLTMSPTITLNFWFPVQFYNYAQIMHFWGWNPGLCEC